MSAICGKCGGELIGFGADASCPFCDLAALHADNERLEKLVTTEAALHFEVHHADLARIAELEATLRDARYLLESHAIAAALKGDAE